MRKFFSLRHMNYLRNIAAIFSAEETKDVKNTVEDSICFPLVAIHFSSDNWPVFIVWAVLYLDHIRPLRERHLRPSLSCLHLLSIKCILLSSPHSGTAFVSVVSAIQLYSLPSMHQLGTGPQPQLYRPLVPKSQSPTKGSFNNISYLPPCSEAATQSQSASNENFPHLELAGFPLVEEMVVARSVLYPSLLLEIRHPSSTHLMNPACLTCLPLKDLSE